MSERGVFAVDRGHFTDPCFASEPFTEREAYAWLSAEAAWKKREARGQKGVITLERGEVCHSVRFMAEAWQWSKSAVDRFMKKMVSRGKLSLQKRDSDNVYFVCNYNDLPRVGATKRDASGTRAGHERDKLEEGKQDPTIVGSDITPPDERVTALMVVLDKDRAEAIHEHRQIRSPKDWTLRAASMMAKELAKAANYDIDPNEAAEAVVRNAWTGFNISWLVRDRRGLRVVHGSQAPPRRSGSDLMADTGNEMLRELQGDPQSEFWNQGRTIDGHSQRR